MSDDSRSEYEKTNNLLMFLKGGKFLFLLLIVSFIIIIVIYMSKVKESSKPSVVADEKTVENIQPNSYRAQFVQIASAKDYNILLFDVKYLVERVLGAKSFVLEKQTEDSLRNLSIQVLINKYFFRNYTDLLNKSNMARAAVVYFQSAKEELIDLPDDANIDPNVINADIKKRSLEIFAGNMAKILYLEDREKFYLQKENESLLKSEYKAMSEALNGQQEYTNLRQIVVKNESEIQGIISRLKGVSSAKIEDSFAQEAEKNSLDNNTSSRGGLVASVLLTSQLLPEIDKVLRSTNNLEVSKPVQLQNSSWVIVLFTSKQDAKALSYNDVYQRVAARLAEKDLEQKSKDILDEQKAKMNITVNKNQKTENK